MHWLGTLQTEPHSWTDGCIGGGVTSTAHGMSQKLCRAISTSSKLPHTTLSIDLFLAATTAMHTSPLCVSQHNATRKKPTANLIIPAELLKGRRGRYYCRHVALISRFTELKPKSRGVLSGDRLTKRGNETPQEWNCSQFA